MGLTFYNFLARISPSPYKSTTKGYFVIRPTGVLTPRLVYFSEEEFDKAADRYHFVNLILVVLALALTAYLQQHAFKELPFSTLLIGLVALIPCIMMIQHFSLPNRTIYFREFHGDLIDLDRSLKPAEPQNDD